MQGEGELTFEELVAAWERQRHTGDRRFPGIHGLRYRDGAGLAQKRPRTLETSSHDFAAKSKPIPE